GQPTAAYRSRGPTNTTTTSTSSRHQHHLPATNQSKSPAIGHHVHPELRLHPPLHLQPPTLLPPTPHLSHLQLRPQTPTPPRQARRRAHRRKSHDPSPHAARNLLCGGGHGRAWVRKQDGGGEGVSGEEG